MVKLDLAMCLRLEGTETKKRVLLAQAEQKSKKNVPNREYNENQDLSTQNDKGEPQAPPRSHQPPAPPGSFQKIVHKGIFLH